MADEPPKISSDQFDFILKSDEKPKRNLALFKAPLWALIAGAGLILFILILIVGSLVGGGSGNTDKLFKVVAQAQEIARVSDAATEGALSDQTQDVAILASTTLKSQQAQVTNYLKAKKIKVTTKNLAKVITGLDTGIDGELTDASSKNAYDATYLAYLKSSLGTYQSALTDAYSDSKPSLKQPLSDAYDSVRVVLAAPQLK